MSREYVLSYNDEKGNAGRIGKRLNSEQEARDWAQAHKDLNKLEVVELYFLGKETGNKFVINFDNEELDEQVNADFEEVEEDDLAKGTLAGTPEGENYIIPLEDELKENSEPEAEHKAKGNKGK